MKYLLTLFCLVALSATSFAQWEGFDDETFDFSKRMDKRPFISSSFGNTLIQHKDIVQDISENGSVDLQLGFYSLKPRRDGILRYKSNYVYGSKITNELKSALNDNKLRTATWSFGVNDLKGYGYDLGSVNLILATGNGFNWNRIETKSLPLNLNDANVLSDFKDEYHFANSSEVGVKVVVLKSLSLDAGYSRQVVFQRNLFWYWAGSFVIREAGNAVIDEFVNQIFKASPTVGPVFNILLKGAYHFAFAELQKDKMNFPFETVPGMVYDTYRFGISYMF